MCNGCPDRQLVAQHSPRKIQAVRTWPWYVLPSVPFQRRNCLCYQIPDNLDLEALLMTVIRRHAAAVMRKHWENARSHQYRELFPHSEDLTTVLHGMGSLIYVSLFL